MPVVTLGRSAGHLHCTYTLFEARAARLALTRICTGMIPPRGDAIGISVTVVPVARAKLSFVRPPDSLPQVEAVARAAKPPTPEAGRNRDFAITNLAHPCWPDRVRECTVVEGYGAVRV